MSFSINLRATCLLFLVSFCAIGCTHQPFRESELGSSEGIVFGKVDSVLINGVEAKDSPCTLTYGENWHDSGPGGLFEKKVELQPGQFFVFSRKSGSHSTSRISCRLSEDITSEIKINYYVVPGSIAYLGRFSLQIDFPRDISGHFLRVIGIPAEMNGGVELLQENHVREDLTAFLKAKPELNKFKVEKTLIGQLVQAK